MRLDTAAGTASVSQACRLFQRSRQAGYEAKTGPRPPRLRVVRDDGEDRESSQSSSSAGATETKPVSRSPRYTPPEELEPVIREIEEAHPAWGVRKVWATLWRAPYGIKAGHRRGHVLVEAMGLTPPPDRSARSQRTFGHVVVEQPNRRWATDLTTTGTALRGLVAIVILIDCGCRTVLEADVTKSQESPTVLGPVRRALAVELGTANTVPAGLELRTDHGPQYTGSDGVTRCDDWGLDHTFAPVGRPTGNAVAERVIRTPEEECVWLEDWDSIAHLQAAIDAWKRQYNQSRPHQASTGSPPRTTPRMAWGPEAGCMNVQGLAAAQPPISRRRGVLTERKHSTPATPPWVRALFVRPPA